MIGFATEFPVYPKKSIRDLLELCKCWLLGSPHTYLAESDFNNFHSNEDWVFEKGAEYVHVSECNTDGNKIGGMKYTKKESSGIEWTTEIVGVKEEYSFWVTLRIFRESQRPSTRLPIPKKPYIIRQIIHELGGGYDGEFKVSESPIYLKNTDIQLAKSLIIGRFGNYLPIVYLSACFKNQPTLDPMILAKHLSGLAHVVVEPNRPFSIRLMMEVNRQNVYGGAVGIYWPEGAGKSTYYNTNTFSDSDSMQSSIIEEIRTALANRRPRMQGTWACLRESLAKYNYMKLKSEGSTELEKYIRVFDEEIAAKEQQLIEAEKDIIRLKNENSILESKCNQFGSGNVLAYGREQEFYEMEFATIILDELMRASNNVVKNSRRQHILTDILSNNTIGEDNNKIKDQIKSIFKDYRTLTPRCRKDLEALGFNITDEGKHHKMIFRGDPRYTFSLPKTSSDHRVGKNLASDIIKNIL